MTDKNQKYLRTSVGLKCAVWVCWDLFTVRLSVLYPVVLLVVRLMDVL